MPVLQEAPRGLEGVVVADTELGDVRGDEGWYHYRGHDATTLARERHVEDVWHLLVLGRLPAGDDEQRAFADRVAAARLQLADDLAPALPGIAARSGPDRMAALRTAWSLAASVLGCRPALDLTTAEQTEQAVALTAAGPLLVAGLHRDAPAPGRVVAAHAHGPTPTASTYLALVTGAEPEPAQVAALDRYLVLTVDHGLNASTFVARTVASTRADLGAVVVAALGALSGPLHGGAPSRALEMLDDIATPDRAEDWIRAALARGERIMGFGHRVYRTEDPRATLLRETARDLGGERVELAVHVEEVTRRVLREAKPDRVLDVNVEYYAAVVLEAVGLPPAVFTPTFAISRAIGWTAHALEQLADPRIIRPTSRYVGPIPAPTSGTARRRT